PDFGAAIQEPVADESVELPEVVAGHARRVALIRLLRPDRVELAEKSRPMVEPGKEVRLVQKRANVPAWVTWCRGRDVGKLVIQVGLREFIARADSQVVANQLVYINCQRSLPVLEPFARARRAVGDRDENAVGEHADGRVHLRIENFSNHAEVGLGRKFLVQGHINGLKSRTGNGPFNRLRNDAPEGLVESADQRRLESDAVVIKDAAQ